MITVLRAGTVSSRFPLPSNSRKCPDCQGQGQLHADHGDERECGKDFVTGKSCLAECERCSGSGWIWREG